MKDIFHACSDWLSVRQNVTLLIACASFFLSVWNCLHDYWRNRRNLSCNIENIFCILPPSGNCTEVLSITIANRSKEAITISQVILSCQEKQATFGKYRNMLIKNSSKVGSEIINSKTWYSDTLPIKIEGLGCSRVLLSSVNTCQTIIDGSPCIAKIFTNKGCLQFPFTAKLTNPASLTKCREPNS